jgi:hypothetical protein
MILKVLGMDSLWRAEFFQEAKKVFSKEVSIQLRRDRQQ